MKLVKAETGYSIQRLGKMKLVTAYSVLEEILYVFMCVRRCGGSTFYWQSEHGRRCPELQELVEGGKKTLKRNGLKEVSPSSEVR